MIRRFANFVLFGGSHIAGESVSALRTLFSKENPDVVALELDKGRFNSLIARMNHFPVSKGYYSPRKIGIQGFLFAKIASFIQGKLALRLGVQPGVEMEESIKLARKFNKNIVLVDKPIEVTLRDFSSKIPLSEKLKLLADPFLSVFHRGESYKLDLNKIPSEKLVDTAIDVMKVRYPHLYSVLVDSRNRFIATRLFRFYNSGERVLVVLGAGHVKGVLEYLKKFERGYKKSPSLSYSFSVNFKS